jgi:hypothetical protein
MLGGITYVVPATINSTVLVLVNSARMARYEIVENMTTRILPALVPTRLHMTIGIIRSSVMRSSISALAILLMTGPE